MSILLFPVVYVLDGQRIFIILWCLFRNVLNITLCSFWKVVCFASFIWFYYDINEMHSSLSPFQRWGNEAGKKNLLKILMYVWHKIWTLIFCIKLCIISDFIQMGIIVNLIFSHFLHPAELSEFNCALYNSGFRVCFKLWFTPKA